MELLSEVHSARLRIMELARKVCARVVGRSEAVRALLIGLVARENVVMISEPGCAKTYIVDLLSQYCELSTYKYLITRFTTDVELFGVYNLKLVEEGVLKRVWSRIVTADLIFLDEVFKGSSEILNTLLSLLNERRVFDPFTGTVVPVKARTVVGASNEVPKERELEALYDRFSIRVFLQPLTTPEDLYEAFRRTWLLDREDPTPVASVRDFEVLERYAETIIRARFGKYSFPELYRSIAIPLLLEIKSAGVYVSNRTISGKFPKILASYLALHGLNTSNFLIGLATCCRYLANEESDLAKIEEVCLTVLEGIYEVARIVEQVEELEREGRIEEAKKLLDTATEVRVESGRLRPFAEILEKRLREVKTRLGIGNA